MPICLLLHYNYRFSSKIKKHATWLAKILQQALPYSAQVPLLGVEGEYVREELQLR